jgi:hypothetical protein
LPTDEASFHTACCLAAQDQRAPIKLMNTSTELKSLKIIGKMNSLSVPEAQNIVHTGGINHNN